MSVEYGTIILDGAVYYDDEAKKIEKLYQDGIITEGDWDQYFHCINAWGTAEEGIVFGLFSCFNEEVCAVKVEDVFYTPGKIQKFEQDMKNKPWFKEIKWEPQKYIINYCY